jgi:succinyl-diaminopimelate desuccinylase
MAIERGRNALVFLAHALAGRIAPSGASDLLAFAAEAGADLHGRALGLDDSDPVWRPNVNVATVKAGPAGDLVLTVNVRVGAGLVKDALARHLHDRVVAFAERTGADVVPGAGTFRSEPLVIDPDAKLVRRLRAAYERVTGAAAPLAVSGGATYAKRIPNAIAFGMWFPGKPYPGHDVDEAQPIADLHRGAEVLIEALVDLATSPPIARPLEP